jgi:hypothetical protein
MKVLNTVIIYVIMYLVAMVFMVIMEKISDYFNHSGS